jgi:hypothetical protein
MLVQGNYQAFDLHMALSSTSLRLYIVVDADTSSSGRAEIDRGCETTC